jgi:hypothetical protein
MKMAETRGDYLWSFFASFATRSPSFLQASRAASFGGPTEVAP